MSEPKNASVIIDEERERADKGREYLVVKHNDLITNNRYTLERNKDNSLTLLEQKIILYTISRIKPDTKEFDFVPFDIKEFAAVIGIETEASTYPRVKAAITKLASRVMWLKSIDKETTVRWIDKAEINKRQGKVYIKLDNDLKPYLIGLYGNFTQFPLHSIVRMKSKYGIMLYEILRAYYHKGHILKFNIDDIKERLDCTSYENFTNFRRKVIEPALKDINTYSEIYVTVEYEKQGHSFTDIIFFMRDLDKPRNEAERIEAARRFYKVEQEINNSQISLFDILYRDNDIEVEL